MPGARGRVHRAGANAVCRRGRRGGAHHPHPARPDHDRVDPFPFDVNPCRSSRCAPPEDRDVRRSRFVHQGVLPGSDGAADVASSTARGFAVQGVAGTLPADSAGRRPSSSATVHAALRRAPFLIGTVARARRRHGVGECALRVSEAPMGSLRDQMALFGLTASVREEMRPHAIGVTAFRAHEHGFPPGRPPSSRAFRRSVRPYRPGTRGGRDRSGRCGAGGGAAIRDDTFLATTHPVTITSTTSSAAANRRRARRMRSRSCRSSAFTTGAPASRWASDQPRWRNYATTRRSTARISDPMPSRERLRAGDVVSGRPKFCRSPSMNVSGRRSSRPRSLPFRFLFPVRHHHDVHLAALMRSHAASSSSGTQETSHRRAGRVSKFFPHEEVAPTAHDQAPDLAHQKPAGGSTSSRSSSPVFRADLVPRFAAPSSGR